MLLIALFTASATSLACSAPAFCESVNVLIAVLNSFSVGTITRLYSIPETL